MQQELLHLGQIFKERRQEKNLSLKEVENATSIRTHFLIAIEEGDLGKLISPVYAQGFIRKYASFLDLESDEIFKEHPSVMKLLSEVAPTRQEFSYGLGSVEVRNTGNADVKWLPSLLWGGGSLLLLAGGWLILRYFKLF